MTETPDPSTTPPDELRSLLERYPADCQTREAPRALGNAGGHSGSRLWRFDADRGPLLLRAWPREGPSPSRLERLHGWLSELRRLPFLPLPIPDRQGRGFQALVGRLWQVEPWMSGVADLARPPARERVEAGFAALGAFHAGLARWGRAGPSPGLADRIREIDVWNQSGFAALGRSLALADDQPERELAARWIMLARRLAPVVREELNREAGRVVALQPCLRDARPEHWLFQGVRLTGLVDFGAMDLESPAADLARLLADWINPDLPLRAAALAAYARVFPLGLETTRLIQVFERSSALLIGGHWARWHFLEKRTFQTPEAVARGLHRGLDRLARLAVEA